jgi:drug/metabolite transporter (DMT)-like permease
VLDYWKLNRFKFSNTTLSIIWIFLWEATFTLAMSCAKLLSSDINGLVLLFMRCFFGFLWCLPFIIKEGKENLHTQRLLLHTLRVIFACATIFATYYTYRHIPMATAASIGFSSILMTTMLAMLILRENVSSKKWVLIIIGYVGVLIVAKPTAFSISTDIFIAVLSSLMGSCFVICTKLLSSTESTFKLVFYNNTASFFLATLIVFWAWETPSLKDLLLLIFMSLAAVFSQFCYVKALKLGKLSFLAPFGYTRLICASCVGFLLFDEVPHVHTYCGAALIIITTYILTSLELTNNNSNENKLLPQFLLKKFAR